MIDFVKEYKECRDAYRVDKELIELPDTATIIHNLKFRSECNAEYRDNKVVSGNLYYYELSDDSRIDENKEFTYPVIAPRADERYDRGILFLHGLNEHSWDKYFVWARYLAEQTGRPVIMFPIAYHINRCPKLWTDPRSMEEVAALRRTQKQSSTFLNAAMSTRLEKNPEKFLVSGIQSYGDVMALLEQIRSGRHPMFNAGASFDIFAYSIGAFLAEILLLNNYEGALRGSKLFVFCGGTTFDSMHGISKYIMDENAFRSLQTLNSKSALKHLRKRVKNVPDWLRLRYVFNGIGLMMSSRKRRRKREKQLAKCAQNIHVVALQQDKVMPVDAVCRTFKGRKGQLPIPVDVIDFPYRYSHEIPFPTGDEKISELVSRCFTVVFDKAVKFFSSK